jgi:hypothetical protein
VAVHSKTSTSTPRIADFLARAGESGEMSPGGAFVPVDAARKRGEADVSSIDADR